jgi:Carbohydrate family 9 binding domain-like
MPRPSSIGTLVAVGIGMLAVIGSCNRDSGPPERAGSGTPSEGLIRLPPVPEPGIVWQPRTYVANWADAAPLIDGSLDDVEWQSAPWTTDFVDIQGPSMPAPRFRTRARLLWDEEYFYVGASLEDPHVWGTLTERDAVIYQDNDFELFLDPDGDTHLYYELEINALGTIWDLMLIKPYRDGGPAVDAWDIDGLRTAVSVDGTINDPRDEDRGWSVEIAIPWDVLAEAAGRPAPPAPGDRWRLNFSRVQWRAEPSGGGYSKLTDPASGDPLPEDNWVWSPQGLIAMHYPEMWGIVEFAGPADPERPPSALTESERALSALFQVYYRQRERAAEHGSWIAKADELTADRPTDADLPWPPAIWLTPSGFEATLRLSDGRFAHIREDGLAWISD